MKYCDECAMIYSFPITSHMEDEGTCVLCGKQRPCNRAPVADLKFSVESLQKTVMAGNEAQKLLDQYYRALAEL